MTLPNPPSSSSSSSSSPSSGSAAHRSPPSSSLSPDSLAPPLNKSVRRARAASTGLRPPLSLTSLTPRVGPYTLPSAQTPDHHLFPEHALDIAEDSDEPSCAQQRPSKRARFANMVPVLLSRSYDLFRAIFPGSSKHRDALFESPISSPRSSIDSDYVLPLSSSRKSSFDAVECTPPSLPSVRVFLFFLPIS